MVQVCAELLRLPAYLGLYAAMAPVCFLLLGNRSDTVFSPTLLPCFILGAVIDTLDPVTVRVAACFTLDLPASKCPQFYHLHKFSLA